MCVVLRLGCVKASSGAFFLESVLEMDGICNVSVCVCVCVFECCCLHILYDVHVAFTYTHTLTKS